MSEIKIFLASSLDLKADREHFRLFIARINEFWNKQGIHFTVVCCENFLDAMSAEGLQNEYNKAVDDSDIFVMLVHNKVGAFTAEEFNRAFGQFSATQKPKIFTYFKEPIQPGSTEGLLSLVQFREKLESLNHYRKPYSGPDNLENHFRDKLDILRAEGFFVSQKSSKSNELGQDPEDSWESLDRMLEKLCSDGNYGKFLPAIENIQGLANSRYKKPSLLKDVADYVTQIRANASKDIPLEISMASIRKDDFIGASNYRSKPHRIEVVRMVEHIFFEENIYFANSIQIPVILYVMTESEAKELDDNEGAPLVPINGYQECITETTSKFNEWQKNYQTSPILWQPFRHRQKNFDSIEDIVKDAVKTLEEDYPEAVQNTQIHLDFQDIHDLNDNRKLLQELRENPCILVIDSISLYHPVLFKKLKESMLDATSNTFVSVIYPSSSIQDIVETLEFSYNISFADLEISKIRGKKGRVGNMFRHKDFSDWLHARFESDFLSKIIQDRRQKTKSNLHSYFNKFNVLPQEES